MNTIIKFFKEEDGASLIEYVLLAAVIGVGALVGMGLVRDESNQALTDASDAMAGRTAL